MGTFKANVKVNNVYVDVDVYVDDDDLREYVKDTYYPGDIFTELELTEWALENDFIKEED